MSSVTETNSVVCSYGKFQPSRPGWIQETQPKWWYINLYEFATVKALWTLVTLRTLLTNKANSQIPKVEIHTRPKLYHFGRYVVRAKLFWLKSFVRSPGWSTHMGKFSSRLPRSHRKNRDLGKRASPASHMNTSIFFLKKEWRGEISETEPARLTGLIWRGP